MLRSITHIQLFGKINGFKGSTAAATSHMPLSICLSTLPRSRGWFCFLTLENALNPWTQHEQSQPPKQHQGEAHPPQLHRLALHSSKMPLKIVGSPVILSLYPSLSNTVFHCSPLPLLCQKYLTQKKKKTKGSISWVHVQFIPQFNLQFCDCNNNLCFSAPS